MTGFNRNGQISYALGVLWVSGTTQRVVMSARQPGVSGPPVNHATASNRVKPPGCAGTDGPRGIHHTIRLTAGMTAFGEG
jgi:hypothetical protein